MLFVIRFTDKPNTLDIRKQFTEPHFAWLSARKDVIQAAGPLRTDPEGNPIGAMWLVELESMTEAEAFFADDPFWVNGLRASVEILQWTKVFPPATPA